jgi:excinuclease ABC subunit A
LETATALAARGRGETAAVLTLNDAPTLLKPAFSSPHLKISHATRHNLKNLEVELPLNRLVCITGVSGSGKTTLVREVLLPALSEKLRSSRQVPKASDRIDADLNGDTEDSEKETPGAAADSSTIQIEGWEQVERAVLVDQAVLGKTPRSNPAVYIGAFDEIRELFAQTELAQQRGLNPSAFSFNSAQGQCERCRGAGFEKIEMQFLSDVFIRCPDCDGRRYRQHILEVKAYPAAQAADPKSKATRSNRPPPKGRGLSIADLLDSTVDEAMVFLRGLPESRAARRAATGLQLLQEVGLGYLRLGQPINTLSGGESQRLKLVKQLAEVESDTAARWVPAGRSACAGGRLFLFDEPTTGLHFDDVRVLLKVFQRLVDAGHSVVVVEHNLEVMKAADWLIDLGPEAGEDGGKIVACGPPEEVARMETHTGRALRELCVGERMRCE